MTWYNYNVAFSGFIADLIAKMVAEGWVVEEGGYDTLHPANYSGFKVLLSLVYGSIPANESTTGNLNFTYILAKVRATYNGATHVPTTTANGGDQRYRIVYNADCTASAKLVYVRGWIWGDGICLDIKADETQAGWSRHFVYIGEVEAQDAGANTCMMLATEWFNRIGDGAYLYSYRYCSYETSFVHVLGDNIGYYPIIHGFGASTVSNKVRPGLLYIWRYENSVGKYANIAYRIPSSIARFQLRLGAEGELDTFTDTAPAPDETFTRLLNGDTRGAYCGTEYLFMTSATGTGYLTGYFWVRSA